MITIRKDNIRSNCNADVINRCKKCFAITMDTTHMVSVDIQVGGNGHIYLLLQVPDGCNETNVPPNVLTEYGKIIGKML